MTRDRDAIMKRRKGLVVGALSAFALGTVGTACPQACLSIGCEPPNCGSGTGGDGGDGGVGGDNVGGTSIGGEGGSGGDGGAAGQGGQGG